MTKLTEFLTLHTPFTVLYEGGSRGGESENNTETGFK